MGSMSTFCSSFCSWPKRDGRSARKTWRVSTLKCEPGAKASWRRCGRARRNLRTPTGRIDPDAAEALRTNVKRIELEAERIQQETLERSFPAAATGTSAASTNSRSAREPRRLRLHLGGLPDELLAPLLQAFDAIPDTPR